MTSFSDFIESAMAEVDVYVDGEPGGHYESTEIAREAVASEEWLNASVRSVTFRDADGTIFETWTRTVEDDDVV